VSRSAASAVALGHVTAEGFLCGGIDAILDGGGAEHIERRAGGEALEA
jgi:hypothetical protein